MDDIEADAAIQPATEDQFGYVALSEAERAKGYVAPVRDAYVHDRCGATTAIAPAMAETFARQPDFYPMAFCSTCEGHFSTGADGEFTWLGSNKKVGTAA